MEASGKRAKAFLVFFCHYFLLTASILTFTVYTPGLILAKKSCEK